MTSCHWQLKPTAPTEHISGQGEFPPLIRQLLYNRGVTTPAQASVFLAADSYICHDPYLLPDLDKALLRIYQAILKGENIAVYGDFDTDGISATAVLVQGLSALGAHAEPYIPHRLLEGHGLSSEALSKLSKQGVSLVITTDCGITDIEQVKNRPRGMDIIITDHHLPGAILPPALAVIDPHREDSAYPFRELAGVGVAYKLLSALYEGVGRTTGLTNYLDLVALGTVADMMPLLDENRYMVASGIGQLRNCRRPGFNELVAQAGLSLDKLEAEHISWTIAPRLNAAGRMEHAISSYNLIMTDSLDEARALAQWLSEKNIERQKLTTTAMVLAREQALTKGVDPLIIVRHEDYPAGLLGLVANKLMDEFHRPSVVIQTGEEVSRGSLRSVQGFNVNEALGRCAELLLHYGGHARAAGFTLATKNLPSFEKMLTENASQVLAGQDMRPQIDIDAMVSFRELGGTAIPAMQQMAPFGQGNPVPTFLSCAVNVKDCRPVGATGQHLKMKLGQDDSLWEAIAFGLGDRSLENGAPLDIVYTIEQDDWNGTNRLRMNIKDFALAGTNLPTNG